MGFVGWDLLGWLGRFGLLDGVCLLWFPVRVYWVKFAVVGLTGLVGS